MINSVDVGLLCLGFMLGKIVKIQLLSEMAYIKTPGLFENEFEPKNAFWKLFIQKTGLTPFGYFNENDRRWHNKEKAKAKEKGG